MICKQCGENMPEDAVFCENCGAHIAGASAQEISSECTKPLTVIQCALILLAFAVPVVNIIVMFMWAYGTNTNENRRNLAYAGLILLGILMGLAIVGLSLFVLAVHFGFLSLTGVL